MNKILKNRLHYTYFLMGALSYFTLLFIGIVMCITLHRVVDANSSRAFLEIIGFLPGNIYFNFFVAVVFLWLLLVIVFARNSFELKSWQWILCFALETLICLLIMRNTYFSTNVILLLVMADVMSNAPSTKYRIIILFILFCLYLVATYDFLSPYIPMASYEDFVSIYKPVVRSFLLGFKNSLVSLNIIVFMLYLFFLVQDKIEENKEFIELNKKLQKANCQLREFADIREKMGETKERNRLAREIHDTLGHTLTGISVGLDAANVMLDSNVDAAKNQLKLLSENARRGLNDVRRSVDKLKPDALERYTLKEALDLMMLQFMETTSVDIHYMCHLPRLDLNNDEQEVVYRIVQESMTNAIRHGKASEIYITIAREKNNLILIVEDNGQGCNEIKKGFGLNHMKDRVELLGGNIRYYGSNGFIVIAEIPIRGESDD